MLFYTYNYIFIYINNKIVILYINYILYIQQSGNLVAILSKTFTILRSTKTFPRFSVEIFCKDWKQHVELCDRITMVTCFRYLCSVSRYNESTWFTWRGTRVMCRQEESLNESVSFFGCKIFFFFFTWNGNFYNIMGSTFWDYVMKFHFLFNVITFVCIFPAPSH